jgi:ribosomal protein S18 acetylase RimI-like enzyme
LELIIRPATPSDIPNLVVLQQQVWIATYADEGIRDEFSRYVLAEFTVEKMSQAVTDPLRSILVAEDGKHLLGYVEIRYGKTPPEPLSDKVVPEINTLYVLERFLGKGIGYKLLIEAENLIKNKGYSGVWLDAFCENHRALTFYERQNFKRVGISYFREMEETYENIVMLKEF